MMPWWVGTFIGSIFLSIIVFISRSYDITWKIQLVMFIPLVLSNLGFWYGFSHAPKFINCWFIGTSINVIIALVLGIFIFDKSINLNTMIGIPLILIGTYFMVR